MEENICCFAGHNEVYIQDTKTKLKEIIEELITTYKVSEFLVGNYGSFDIMALNTLVELKEKYKTIQVNIVIPYLTKSISEIKNYDNIIVADIPINTPRKFYIIKTNEYMVNKSNFLICYVKSSWGGASKTYNYAKKKKLKIFNIADI